MSFKIYSIRQFFLTTANDLLNIFYPRFCLGCGAQLLDNEIGCCDICYNRHVPILEFYKTEDNSVMDQMYNRVGGKVCTFYKFTKGGLVQKLIHGLKYNGQHQIGFELGRRAGKKLLEYSTFKEVDYIIPVPLHKRKLRKRGYNQSERIAAGISSVLNVPVREDVLLKIVYNQTQTKKNREQRRKNSLGLYFVNQEIKYHNKHFLLVDDVLTTGATLEACSQELLKIPGAKVSLFALAKA